MSESTLENGPLRVLRGSHREPLHEVVPDRRAHAKLGVVPPDIDWMPVCRGDVA